TAKSAIAVPTAATAAIGSIRDRGRASRSVSPRGLRGNNCARDMAAVSLVVGHVDVDPELCHPPARAPQLISEPIAAGRRRRNILNVDCAERPGWPIPDLHRLRPEIAGGAHEAVA